MYSIDNKYDGAGDSTSGRERGRPCSSQDVGRRANLLPGARAGDKLCSVVYRATGRRLDRCAIGRSRRFVPRLTMCARRDERRAAILVLKWRLRPFSANFVRKG